MNAALPSSPSLTATPAGATVDARATRLVYVLALLFLAFLWSFVGYWLVSVRQEALVHAEQVLRRMNHAVEEQTRRAFKTVEMSFGMIDRWTETAGTGDLRTDARFRALLDELRTHAATGVDLHLVSSNGQILSSPRGAGGFPASINEADYFRDAMAGDDKLAPIGAPLKGGDGTWLVPIAHRLPAKAKGAGAVLATIRLEALISLYEEERWRPNGAIVLLRRDGTLLARAPHDERLMGRSLASGQLYREYLPRAERGVANLDRTVTDAREKIAAYAMMRDLPLLVVVSAERGDVLEAWRHHATIIVLLALGVTAVSVYVAMRLSRLLGELSARTAELHRLATIDAMTGVSNRHHFLSLLYHEFARARRYKSPLSLMVLDLDFFKQINDGYGHAAGDSALLAFAQAAGDCLRGMDVIGRMGGEEFAVLLPNTALEQGEAVAERIRAAVACIAIDTEFGTVRYTASIGVTEAGEDDTSIDTLLARADVALYAAKAAGRNRVVVRTPADR